jgi:carbonic anhydrase
LAAVSTFNDGFYHYAGSLTTPPCSEGVDWWVGKNKADMGVAQFNTIQEGIGYSARLTQQRGALI